MSGEIPYRKTEGVRNAPLPNIPTTIGITSVLPIDMTEILRYEKMADDITQVNAITGPMFMQQFNRAIDIMSKHHSSAVFEYERAKTLANRAFAVAKLDKAPAELEKRGIKATDGMRETYAEQDPEYLMAKEVEAYWKAMVVFLETKVSRFEKSHDDAKKIYDRVSEPRGSSSALPSGRDSG